MMIWAQSCRQAMGMLAPKLIPLFYHVGKKITMPNCPIEMLPSFNPSSGAQFFNGAGSACRRPAYYGLPFFLENFGPRFSEWSVTAHEAWPGHHTQIQGRLTLNCLTGLFTLPNARRFYSSIGEPRVRKG